MKYLIKATSNENELHVWLADHSQIWDASKECEERIYTRENPAPQALLQAVVQVWRKVGKNNQGPVIGPLNID
jgi:hypothetical protein